MKIERWLKNCDGLPYRARGDGRFPEPLWEEYQPKHVAELWSLL